MVFFFSHGNGVQAVFSFAQPILGILNENIRFDNNMWIMTHSIEIIAAQTRCLCLTITYQD
jgi:hypothetical protein